MLESDQAVEPVLNVTTVGVIHLLLTSVGLQKAVLGSIQQNVEMLEVKQKKENAQTTFLYYAQGEVLPDK